MLIRDTARGLMKRGLMSGVCAMLLVACADVPPAREASPAWKNSLGMTFQRVTGASHDFLMATYETRERDMALFREDQGHPRPTAQIRSAEAPAAFVSWQEARDYCAWLTRRERQSGLISPAARYRLPTDHEWSCAVGIGHLEDASLTPEFKSNRLDGRYPWGTTWPPPRGSGNLCGEESRSEFPDHFISGYRDGLAGCTLHSTASVGNDLGLHDLSGSLWEWCEDCFRAGTDWRVLRGGSWKSVRPQTLLSSHRTHDPEGYRSDSVGFRCVLEGP